MDSIVRLCTMPGPSRPVDGMWGMLVVPPTGERGGGSVALWLLVGRDVAVVDDRRRALVRNQGELRIPNGQLMLFSSY